MNNMQLYQYVTMDNSGTNKNCSSFVQGFKHKFKSVRAEIGEVPNQFIVRLESYLIRWIDLANVGKDFDGLINLIAREQYLESCPVHLAIFVREETKGFG